MQEDTDKRRRWVEILSSQFLNRRDFLAVEAPWGKPAPIEIRDEEHLQELLRCHVFGEDEVPISFPRGEGGGRSSSIGKWRVGSYCPAPGTNLTKWLCVDIDSGGHKSGVKDVQGTGLRIRSRAELLEIPCYLEWSRSGDGLHVWVFFSEPVPASVARDLGLALCPFDVELEKPTRSGETLADPTRNRGLEVFPKQSDIGEGFGNLVWLPWFFGNKKPGGQFIKVVSGRKSSAFVLDDDPSQFSPFETISSETAKKALEKAGGWRRDEKQRAKIEASDTWRRWRTDALERLDLDAVYGSLLTGKTGSGGGWLECRDPDSGTGDRNPSAGVSTGKDAERGAFHTFLTEETISVFDWLVREGRASSFIDAVAIIADLTGVPLPARDRKGKLQRSAEKPQIMVTHAELHEVIAESWDALSNANHPPRLFRKATKLVQLHLDNDNQQRFLVLSHHGVADWLSRAAQFVRQGKEGPQITNPPEAVTKRMAEACWDEIPPLDTIVSSPFFDADGKLVRTKGYHRPSRTWFAENGLEIDDISDTPTPKDVEESLILLTEELLGGFPFIDSSSRCHALAMLILPFVRRMIDGETPAHLIEGPQSGTGKTLLAKAVFAVSSGEKSTDIKSLPTQEEEIQKTVFAELRQGPAVVCFDNLPDKVILNSPALLAVLTTNRLRARVLKASEVETVPNLATWILTGNNPRLSRELARRCIRVRMDAACERPQDRPLSDFPHELPGWAILERGALVRSLLTLVQFWLAQGRPEPQRSLGGFESWSRVVGGILCSCQVPGWLENLPDLYEESESESEEWTTLVGLWAKSYPPPNFATSGQIMRIAATADVLPEALRTDVRKMGLALSGHRDQVFGEFIIRKGGLQAGSRTWSLERVEKSRNPVRQEAGERVKG